MVNTTTPRHHDKVTQRSIEKKVTNIKFRNRRVTSHFPKCRNRNVYPLSTQDPERANAESQELTLSKTYSDFEMRECKNLAPMVSIHISQKCGVNRQVRRSTQLDQNAPVLSFGVLVEGIDARAWAHLLNFWLFVSVGFGRPFWRLRGAIPGLVILQGGCKWGRYLNSKTNSIHLAMLIIFLRFIFWEPTALNMSDITLVFMAKTVCTQIRLRPQPSLKKIAHCTQ